MVLGSPGRWFKVQHLEWQPPPTLQSDLGDSWGKIHSPSPTPAQKDTSRYLFLYWPLLPHPPLNLM